MNDLRTKCARCAEIGLVFVDPPVTRHCRTCGRLLCDFHRCDDGAAPCGDPKIEALKEG